MKQSMSEDGWKESELLPEDWLYKKPHGNILKSHPSGKVLSKSGVLFDSLFTSKAYMQQQTDFNESDVKKIEQIIKENKDNTLPEGWKSRKTDLKVIFLSPENQQYLNRADVLKDMYRLMYNDSYYTIDSNLTDGNVGARKNRSVRDNIFVLGAITNSVSNGNSPPIQIQVMDAIKCFDKLWLQACINSLYEAGLNIDPLNLLYIENRNAQIAVKGYQEE